jgi:phosphatidylglycerophosphate synthase
VQLGIAPDTVSYLSIVAASLAGVCFLIGGRWHAFLLLAPLFCYVRLWLNMLDGMVALAAGKASKRGEIVNDLPDRFSDVIIFACVAESGLCHPSLAYWSAIAAVLTAYVGTLSQAVGAPRQFGGWMSKPWRMVVLSIGTWAMWALTVSGDHFAGTSLSPLDWACIVILVGCAQTIFVRLRRTLSALNKQ